MRLHLPLRTGAILCLTGLAAAQCEWLETAFVQPTDVLPSARFGDSLAVSGDTALVGAPFANPAGRGAVYVFRREPGAGWVQTAKLLASDGQHDDRFGQAVAIDGTTAVIGSPLDDDDGPRSGSAYVFERTADGVWVEVEKLKASNAVEGDEYGTSVGIEGDVIVVGAPDRHSGCIASGSVYIHERSGGSPWSEVDRFDPPSPNCAVRFGSSLSISGNFVAVGWPGHSGRVTLLRRNFVGQWSVVDVLTRPNSQGFGWDVAIDGDTVLIGERYDDDLGENSGAAFVFDRNPATDTWSFTKKLRASDGSASDFFGRHVDLVGDVAVVGVNNHEHASTASSGAVFVFERDAGGADEWGETFELRASPPVNVGELGSAVAIAEGAILAGSAGVDSAAGAMYVFSPSDASSYCVTTPNSVGPGAQIGVEGGTSVSANQTTLVATGVPPFQPGVFFMGSEPAQLPGAGGFICIASGSTGVLRLVPPLFADGGGVTSAFVDLPALASPFTVVPGSTWYFQHVYRDAAAMSGSRTNSTDGVELAFCP